MKSFRKLFKLVAVGCWLVVLLGSVSARELLPPGFRPLPLGVHALVGGRVVIQPGETLDPATIVIRDGLIQAVGKDVPIPGDARVWDLQGATVYAGFIEPYLVFNTTNPPVSTSEAMPVTERSLAAGGAKFYGAPGAQTDMGSAVPGSEIARINPQFQAIEKFSPKDEVLAPLRDLGFAAGVIVPAKGIVRGTSALVALADQNPNRAIIQGGVFQHIAFDTESDGGVYPNSLMGVIAAIRQTFFDAQHYQLDLADYRQHPQGRKRSEFNPALAALNSVTEKKTPVMFEPGSTLMDDRAARLARELNLDFLLVSCGEEWRRPDLAKATRATFIVPLNFPTLPKLPSEEDWDQVSLDQLRAWDWAPENPALLRQQGLEIALTTYGLSDKKTFRKNLQLAMDRGLSETDALAALTTIPAKLCGVENQLGTVRAGKLANLVVVDGCSYFNPEAKVRAVWIDGRIYPSDTESNAAKPEEAKGSQQTGPNSTDVGTPKEGPEKHPQPSELVEKKTEAEGSTNTPPPKANGEKSKETVGAREIQKRRVAQSPLAGRGPLVHAESFLIRNATIWTSGLRGVLTNANLLVSKGKIVEVEPDACTKTNSPQEWLEVDGTGLHLTPGIIDCHSHAAVLGDVNETGLPSTAMVRITDVVNSESDNFYRELAGGVTTLNLLHGSANPIGGQNCVIKLRDGASPTELIFSNAPSGIKFALGENVKQANWGEKFTTRFPQSRMGVRTFIQNRFVAAQQYLREWDNYRKQPGQGGIPPRRDLELEAIGEILQGQRWIHCHAYRQDEMLMLTRLMQDFGVQIGTFQHALEGYKIADELAAANIGASTFSDWWGFKFEAFDAIPFNGSLLHDRGVVVSFNSDFSELARRLYLEAAKAVKYGGISETEALKFITLNPAKQLRIDPYVGSLEPGKDADFVLWSKAPLDSGTVCLQTWIDGKKYFDRALDKNRTDRLHQERADLIAKAKKITQLSSGAGQGAGDGGKAFFRVALEHEYDGRERDCLDESEGGR